MRDSQLFDDPTLQEINRLLSDWTLEVGLQFDLSLTPKKNFNYWLSLSLVVLDVETVLTDLDLPVSITPPNPNAEHYRVDFADDIDLTGRLFGLVVITFEDIYHAHS